MEHVLLHRIKYTYFSVARNDEYYSPNLVLFEILARDSHQEAK